MSADRYEITDDGRSIYIKSANVTAKCWDDVYAAAIRQQARDIAELEVFAEIGRQWNTDSSLAKWFPLTADRLGKDAQEIAKLRADLAAAVARAEQAEARLAAIDNAPTVAVIHDSHGNLSVARAVTRLPDEGTELIAGPAEDSQSAFEETARSAGIRFDDIENHEDKP